MSPALPRWLFVVSPGQHELYERLSRRLGGIAVVVYDRRREMRRRGHAPIPAERRRRDRRRPLTPKERVQASLAGYRAVYRTATFDVYEAHERTPAPCPECGLILEFDMPRFAEAPARVDVEVVHTTARGVARHFVDLEATTASGRTLLACRLEAEPHAWHVDEPSGE